MTSPHTNRLENTDPQRLPHLRHLGIAAFVVVIWNVVSWQFPFFWDTVLNSKIAHWYLESGFSSLTVPESLDAGHPPFFNLYLALVWRVTGPALWSAHLAMLPFLLVLVVQWWKLGLRFLPAGLRGPAMVLLFCEPTFLAQSSMVTPDIVLVALFLTSVNAVLEGRRKLLGLVLVGMAAATFRGILAVPAVFLIDGWMGWINGRRRPNWRGILPYLPVAGLTLLWLWVHYRAAGWLLTPPPETYGAHRKVVGLGDILRNLGIVGWRFLDFGRVALWLVFGGIILFGGRMKWWKNARGKALLLMFFAPAALLTVLFIPFSNPIGMRYFLVCYLLFMLLVIYVLGQVAEQKWRNPILLLIGLVLASGHFWVYPDSIAKSWDSSLAHLPYFEIRHELNREVRLSGCDRGIPCTDFPMLAPMKYSDMSRKEGIIWQDKKEMKSLEDCDCVLWSNISNGFEAEDMRILNDLYKFYKTGWAWRGQVEMVLYRRDASIPQH